MYFVPWKNEYRVLTDKKVTVESVSEETFTPNAKIVVEQVEDDVQEVKKDAKTTLVLYLKENKVTEQLNKQTRKKLYIEQAKKVQKEFNLTNEEIKKIAKYANSVLK